MGDGFLDGLFDVLGFEVWYVFEGLYELVVDDVVVDWE